jgi:hypothetical protein
MRLAATFLLLALQARENPQFEAWKGFKAGSWIRLKVETIEDGEKVLSEETETLVSAAADKVVIQRKSVTTLNGRPFTATDKDELAARTDAIKKIETGGDEEIEVAGKKLSCRIMFVTRKPVDSSGDTRHKLWLHADVPGGVARSESTSLKQNKVVATAVALGWEKK